jgi:hypothetical protein
MPSSKELIIKKFLRTLVDQTVKRYKEDTSCIEKQKYPTQKQPISTPVSERIMRKCDCSATNMATAF